MKITFTRTYQGYRGDKETVTITTNAVSVLEIQETFNNFLRACGFHVSREEEESIEPVLEECEDECPGTID